MWRQYPSPKVTVIQTAGQSFALRQGLKDTNAKPRLFAKVICVFAALIFTSGIRVKIAFSSRS